MNAVFETPVCGCLGCHNDADRVIDHPRYGEHTVCKDHTQGHEVVRYV